MKLRLKELRKAAGLTQRQLAEKAGMSVSYYTEIELGRKQINAHRMEKLSEALRCEPYELIDPQGNREHAKMLSLLPKLDEDQKRLVHDLVVSLVQSNEQKPTPDTDRNT